MANNVSARGSRVFAPPVRHHGFEIPLGFKPPLLAAAVIFLILLAWAFLGAQPVSNNEPFGAPALNAANVRSVAYLVPSDGSDRLFIRHLENSDAGTQVASFPASFNLHARGSASPLGDSAAVLSVSPSTSPLASLNLVNLRSRTTRTVEESFDYLSPVSWSPDGRYVVLRRSGPADEAGRASAVVSEVEAAIGRAVTVAGFDDVYEVAPVGYSLDGRRLFIVVVDQEGSSLWAKQNGRLTRVASLSPGKTRDWRLSPDGSRLAFIDVPGATPAAYSGRTLVIATGTLSASPAGLNQLGAAWLPGSDVPMFGGPGGSIQLSEPAGADAYVVPAEWSPDGSTLVATIYSASDESSAGPTPSLEFVTANRRVPIASGAGASFVGWVQDLP